MSRVQVPIDAGVSVLKAHALAGTVAAAVSAAGSSQSDATLITHCNNLITTASAGQGVRLPSFNAGDIVIANGTAVTVLVYPVSGAKLNNDTANDPISLPAGGGVIVKALSATSYLAVYAPPVTPMSAAEILAALLTVDGTGSGLDADQLDGQSSAFYAAASSVPAAAAQSDQETATSTTTYVSPGRQHFHPSALKAWLRWNMSGTPAIAASYNVSSITDHGTGDQSVNFTTAFSTANYGVATSCLHVSGVAIYVLAMQNTLPPTASACRLQAWSVETDLDNDNTICSALFSGDQ